jgi:hypothetical protein
MQLVDRPVFFPAACLLCGHTGEQHGPYVDTLFEMDKPGFPPGGRIYFCGSCTGRICQAVDVVPRKKLQEALEVEKRFEAVEAESCLHAEAARAANERADRLEGELAGARDERDSVKRTLAAKITEAARDRRASLLAEVAGTSTTPTPKRKRATTS